MMRRLMMFSVACVLALGLTAGRAEAIPLTIGTADLDADYYVGQIIDGIPSSFADEARYINNLITLGAGQGNTSIPNPDDSVETYNRVGSDLEGLFPTALIEGAVKNETGEYTGINVTGFTYILGKYDAGNPGAGAYVWYVGGLTGVTFVALPATSPGGYELGHYTLFNARSVPDGGTTLILLGGALVGLGILRRKFNV
jgi:hypothetical protein